MHERTAEHLIEASQQFEVRLADESVFVVADADTYEQEGPLTTFFRRAPGRQVVDCWSDRVASYRTSDIASVTRQPA